MKIEHILETARSQIGYREGANNNNIYGREYGLNFQPWCVIFLWWCFKHSLDGATEKLSDFMPNSAHCNGVRAFALTIDRWYPRKEIGLHVEPEPGDLVIFDWVGDGSGDHIGIIEAVTDRDHYTTIEGNHNDAVCRVNRSMTGVLGLYKPLYDFDFREAEKRLESINADVDDVNAGVDAPEPEPEPETGAGLALGATGPAVSIMQYALHVRGFEPAGSRKQNGDYDGEFGQGTQDALDRFTGHNKSICTAEVWEELTK